MSNPQNRLAMFHGHLKFQDETHMQPEFPMVSRHERARYASSSFQSMRPDFAAKSRSPSINRTAGSNFSRINADESTFSLSPGNVTRASSPYKDYADSSNALGKCIQRTERLFGVSAENDGHATLISGESRRIQIKVLESVASSSGGNVLYISIGAHSQPLEHFRSQLSSSNITVASFRVNPARALDKDLLIETLQSDHYAAVVMDHASEEFGASLDIQRISRCVRKFSPNAMIAIDVTRSSGIQDIQAELWRADLVFNDLRVSSLGDTELECSVAYISKKCWEAMDNGVQQELRGEHSNLDAEILSGTGLYFDRLFGPTSSSESASFLQTTISQYQLLTHTFYSHFSHYFDILPEEVNSRVNSVCSFVLTDDQHANFDMAGVEKDLSALGIDFNHAYSDELQRYFFTLNFKEFDLSRADHENSLQDIITKVDFMLT